MATRKKETAAECYDRIRGEIAILTRDLKLKLAEHERQFKATGSRNWGYPGDLAYCHAHLYEIVHEQFASIEAKLPDAK